MRELNPDDFDQLQPLVRALRFARAQIAADFAALRLLTLTCVFIDPGPRQRELLGKIV